uniref:Uncharacterized protein n=1 Tax=Cacopsylla melanoneura TaxID=428564 RepID=A0A8D8TTG3_9HEMI
MRMMMGLLRGAISVDTARRVSRLAPPGCLTNALTLALKNSVPCVWSAVKHSPDHRPSRNTWRSTTALPRSSAPTVSDPSTTCPRISGTSTFTTGQTLTFVKCVVRCSRTGTRSDGT